MVPQKIWRAFAANGFGQAVTIAIQISTFPIFLYKWSITELGVWLMLSAGATYFSLSDVGVIGAARNRMAILAGNGQTAEAERTFQSGLTIIIGLSIAAMGLSSLTVVFMNGGVLAPVSAKLTFLLLMASVILSLWSSLAEGIYRANDRYPTSIFLSNIARLAEWIGGLAGFFLGGRLVDVAAGMLVGRLVATIGVVLHAKTRYADYRWHPNLHFSEVRTLLPLSFSSMLFPLGSLITIQGVVLVVGSLSSPAAVTVLSAYRTVSRVILQGTGMVGHSFWNEFSLLFGGRRYRELANAYAATRRLTILLALGSALVILVCGDWIISKWTHGTVPYSRSLIILFMVASMIGAAWHAPRILLLATNQHTRLSIVNVLSALATLAVCYALLAWTSSPVHAAGIAIAFGELLVAAYALHQVTGLFNEWGAVP